MTTPTKISRRLPLADVMKHTLLRRRDLTSNVQHRAPMAADEAVGTQRESPPDLPVEPVPPPQLHHDVAGERLDQPDVRLRRVPDLPVEPPDHYIGEPPRRGDLLLTRRQRFRRREDAPARHAGPYLVVHLLELREER